MAQDLAVKQENSYDQKDLDKYTKQVETFFNVTLDNRTLCERDRDYKNNIQWTSDERTKIIARGQAPITVNRVKPKVEGLKGLLVSRRTDPKALPRTPKHEKGAEAVTDGLRYVNDNVDLDQVELEVADNVFVEGTGAAIIEVKGDEITVEHIPWDLYYYDVHSRKLDFSDKTYDGFVIWLSSDDVQLFFKLSDDETEALFTTSFLGAVTDRPETLANWVDGKERRIKVCQNFHLEKGVWKVCYFTYGRFLIEPQDSPWVDEEGNPVNPIEAVSANIDRDNNRFGEVRYWIDLQDEINHRRAKYLFLLSARQTAARKGAIQDVPGFKREMSKPDGHYMQLQRSLR